MRERYIDISPASVAQVQQALGKTLIVEDDVQNVARDIAALGAFHLHYDQAQDVWIVMQIVPQPDGSEKEEFVSSFTECDQRIVHRVREITAPGYDLEAEIAARDAALEKAKDDALREQTGDVGERLLHAIRHDKGEQKVSVLLPRGVDG